MRLEESFQKPKRNVISFLNILWQLVPLIYRWSSASVINWQFHFGATDFLDRAKKLRILLKPSQFKN